MYITSQCFHPTTLIICSSRQEFEYALAKDIQDQMKLHNTEYEDDGQQEESDEGDDFKLPAAPIGLPEWIHPLLSGSIFRDAVARHIRVLFVPSLSHLRAFLTVFPPADPETVEPPPTVAVGSSGRKAAAAPLLLLYGFLEIHRETSEWGAQGLSNTAAALVEAARNASLRAAIVEPRLDWTEQTRDMESVLAEEMPLLSGVERRAAGRDLEEGSGGWTGRTVAVRRVIGRWFSFEEGPWDGLKPIGEDQKTKNRA